MILIGEQGESRLRIVVIGLGSMGKRRIRLLKQIDETIEITGVDTRDDRRHEAETLYGIHTCGELQTAFDRGCDCAVISTSPLSHAVLIDKCLRQGLHIFTELNLVTDKYDENIRLAAEQGRVLFLSSTFLYRDEINYIRQKVAESRSELTYSYHVGQYLPDWHPWESYTEYFVGDSRTNGCREIMAIDFPWLYKTFGQFRSVSVKKGKKTSLKTTYNDSYVLLVEHTSGVQGSIIVDVVTRKATRAFEVFGEDLYISWDGTPFGLKRYDIETKQLSAVNLYEAADALHQPGYAEYVVENAYKKELEIFLGEIEGREKSEYGFEDDAYILSVIDKIERD